MPAGRELGKIIWNKVQESSKVYFCIIFDCYCRNLIFGGTATQSLHPTLRRVRNFHLISWCGNFVGGHSFRGVSGSLISWCVNFVGGGGHSFLRISCETLEARNCRNCAFSKKFYTRKLGEVFIFGAVQFLESPYYSSFSQVLYRLAARKTEDIKFHFTCGEFNLHLNVIKFQNIVTRFLAVARIIGFQNYLPMFQLKLTGKMFQNCKPFYEHHLLKNMFIKFRVLFGYRSSHRLGSLKKDVS